MARAIGWERTSGDRVGRRQLAARVALAFPGGFEFGGIGRMMLYVTAAWNRTPAPPHVMLLDPRGTGSPLLMSWHLPRALMQLASAQLAGSVDLLHLNVAGRSSTLRKIVLSEFANVLSLPTVVHLHDYDYARYLDICGRPTEVLARRMFRRAKTVIVLGERDRQTVAERLGVAPERIVTLHNAAPDPGPPPVRERRQGSCRILFLGHLDDRKGVPELLSALASPRASRLDWTLDLAGAGEVDRFRAEVIRLGLSDRTTLHGWLPVRHVVELCRRADIFVLPSHAEGQAMSLLEAMSHGLAIVTTPVGAHLEAVADGREALLVAPGDVSGLAGALAQLVDDRAMRIRLGAAARSRYVKDFAIDPYGQRLAALHSDAICAAGRS